MQVTLTPHGEELLRDQLARNAGSSPEEILERALEALAEQQPAGRRKTPAEASPAQRSVILSLARAHRLTAYDAAYLDLAQRAGLPLATLGGELRKAACATGTALVELEP